MRKFKDKQVLFIGYRGKDPNAPHHWKVDMKEEQKDIDELVQVWITSGTI